MTSFQNLSVGFFIWPIAIVAGFVLSVFIMIKLYYYLQE